MVPRGRPGSQVPSDPRGRGLSRDRRPGRVRRLALALFLAALLAPQVAAAEEGLSWAEVREVTLKQVEGPSIWQAAAACGAVLAVLVGLAIVRRR